MKYKIIKKFPGWQDYHDIIETDSSATLVIPGTNLRICPRNWPEHFEPVKEPLFTTYDGVGIFEMKGYVHEVYKTETPKCIIMLDCFPNNKSSYFFSDDNYKYFSTKEAAEKWIDENKPVFSKKQIVDAIGKAIKGVFELRGTFDPETRIDTVFFKQELGL